MSKTTRRTFLGLFTAAPVAAVAGLPRKIEHPDGVTETFAGENSCTWYDEGVEAMATGAVRWEEDGITCHLMDKGYKPGKDHTASNVFVRELRSVELANKRAEIIRPRWFQNASPHMKLSADDVSFGERVTLESRGVSLVAHVDLPGGGGWRSIPLLYHGFGDLYSSFDGDFTVAWNPAGIACLYG